MYYRVDEGTFKQNISKIKIIKNQFCRLFVITILRESLEDTQFRIRVYRIYRSEFRSTFYVVIKPVLIIFLQ